MVSHSYKCIFIHIPKTAGASIERILWPTADDRIEKNLWKGFVSPYQNKYQTGGLQHLFAQNVLKAVGHGIYDNYFTFSIIRNPWDKVVSQFIYLQRRSDLRRFLEVPRHCSFTDYLHQIQLKPHVHWQPQTEFLVDENGDIMVDYIGTFENYEASVRKILHKVSFADPGIHIPHLNQSKRHPYWMYYSQETIELVHKIYKKDIDRFGYTFNWDAWQSRDRKLQFPVPINAFHSKYVGVKEAYGKWKKRRFK